MADATPSQVRQNYHPECEAAVNDHIHVQLYASYVALSLAFFFDRDDVALKDFASYFLKRSQIERERAEKMMRMQNKRGGRNVFPRIHKPDHYDKESALEAMESAIFLAKCVNQSLLDLHELATSMGDVHLCYFLETHYMQQQVQDIEELGGYLTNLRKMGAPNVSTVEYLFEKLTLGQGGKEN
ncbi:ferritin heavy chain [Oryctolagus cuniculus]|uniref:Ferritin n=1 Tax=Oryctolagus cuniculus TaxID=9986 RepID=G1TT46_RABIT